jgi:polysaccharide biosynthesis protein PslF
MIQGRVVSAKVTSGRRSASSSGRKAGAQGQAPFYAFGHDPESAVRVGFVSTYRPTRCGIATFTESLKQSMVMHGSARRFGVVSCVDQPGAVQHPPVVVSELVRGSAVSLDAAAAALDRFDVVVVQHEFGIFGGESGHHVVDLVARLNVPVIVVLHTVLERPTPLQREIIERLAAAAEFVVVQSKTARARLLAGHAVEPERVLMIPHGARPNLGPAPAQDLNRRPMILTWGLIGPGKGIEFMIEALGQLRDLDPPPRYVVLGQTHPRVLASEGESYRESLTERAHALGVDHLVEFDDSYRPTESVLAQIRAADMVVLPYRSRDQVVSGVLVEAIASGKPVVATRFPHAIELLGKGSGLLVPHEDPDAIAAALRSLLTDPGLAARTAGASRKQASMYHWENVGRAYLQLAVAAASVRVRVAV